MDSNATSRTTADVAATTRGPDGSDCWPAGAGIRSWSPRALRRQGCKTYCLGVIGHADPAVGRALRRVPWIGLAKLSAALRFFRRHGVTDATMIGKIHKAVLFGRGGWICATFPTWHHSRASFPTFSPAARTARMIRSWERWSRPSPPAASALAPPPTTHRSCLVKEGQLTRLGPSGWQWKDIQFGWTMAKEMGRLDIGQSVAGETRPCWPSRPSRAPTMHSPRRQLCRAAVSWW